MLPSSQPLKESRYPEFQLSFSLSLSNNYHTEFENLLNSSRFVVLVSVFELSSHDYHLGAAVGHMIHDRNLRADEFHASSSQLVVLHPFSPKEIACVIVALPHWVVILDRHYV